jgi:hypothetical protein
MFKQFKKTARKLRRIHVGFSVGLAIAYIVLALVYSPEFLLSDIRNKFSALADEALTMTARVLGPPQEPIVSSSTICSNGNLSVRLDWSDDENSESFGIEKNGALLVDGLVESQYADEMVAVGNTYTYVVIAYGPMGPGSAQSQPVVVTTPDECQVVLPDPVVNISTFAEKSLAEYIGTPETKSRRPSFTGTTNIPNAKISILVSNTTIISAQITANQNGYWSWTSPIDVSWGTHTIDITAVDPLDESRIASTNLIFKVAKSSEKENQKDEKQAPAVIEQPSTKIPLELEIPSPAEKIEIPLEFLLTLKNEAVLQGKDLETVINIQKIAPAYEGMEAIVRYSIFDERGENKISVLENSIISAGKEINKKINIPGYFKNGKYQVRAEIIFDRYNVSQEKFFDVIERPVLKLGGGMVITYPELLSNLGLLASFLIVLLLFWLILFLREHRLYLRAIRHITEKNLEKVGLFGSKRKGANR